MASEFEFLRARWPKLAALGANASRLVDISPSSAISSMRTYCEWVAEILLDMFHIQAPEGVDQAERLEILKNSNAMPTDILQKMHAIRTMGSRGTYQSQTSADEAHTCTNYLLDISHWLITQTELRPGHRAAAPREYSSSRTPAAPRTNSYAAPTPPPRPVRPATPAAEPLPASYAPEKRMAKRTGSVGGSGSENSAGSVFLSPIQRINPIRKGLSSGLITIIVWVVVAILAVWLIFSLTKCKGGNTNAVVSPPSVVTSPTLPLEDLSTASEDPSPSPTIEPVYLDSITPATSFTGFFAEKWSARTHEGPFCIDTTVYDHGLGLTIPSTNITEEQGSKSVVFDVEEGKYSKLTFDLGTDKNWCYGAEYGSFRITVSVNDGDVKYNSGTREYDYTDTVEVDLGADCKKITIKITQKKGTGGTLNVVMGDARLE